MCVAQAQMLAQGAEGVQNLSYSRTALWGVEQMWGDASYRERGEPTEASESVQLCWAQSPTGVSLTCGQLGSPPFGITNVI